MVPYRFSACCVSIRTSCFTSSMLRVIPACASRFSVRSRSSDAFVSELCRELGIRPVTLYRYVGPQGQLREQGEKVLAT